MATTNELTIDGLVSVQRAELSNYMKDGQDIVVLNLHLSFASFAAAATALAAIGSAVSAQPTTEPAAKPAKAVAAAVAVVATKEPAPKPAVAPKPAATVAPKPPAVPVKAAASTPPPPAAAAQKAAAAVAASGGPRAPVKPPAAAAPKPAAAAPKPPAAKPKPAPEPEPAAEETPALDLTEFQAAALEAFTEIDTAKQAKGENPLNFKDVMLWLIAAYGGEGDAFDAAAVNAEAITLDVQALRTAVPAIDRVPEADLVSRIQRAIESLLTQRAAS